jgi:hypothetical protein
VSPETAPVHALLAAVRARLRRSQFLRGAGLVVVALCSAVLASFALDWLLDMPVLVRAVHLALVVFGLAALARWAFLPLRTVPSDADLASAIEHDVPEFQDRFASALDFERRLTDADEPESREMMAAAVRDAAAIAGRLDGSLLVDGRPARRSILLALGATTAVFAAALAFPDEFGLWIRRGLLLHDVSWPRRTTIVVEGFPESGPLTITRGEDLRIVARADGTRPADLDLHLEELTEAAEGEEPAVAFRDVRKMFPVPDQPGRYAFDFRAVSASFRFWVTGGDDTDRAPVYEVRSLVPPRVASFSARVEAPAYTGLPAVEVRDPVFEALSGSRITLGFTANMPLASARLVPSEGTAPDLVLADDGRTLSASFELTGTLEFHLELRARAGHANRNEDDVFRIDAATDRPPTVRMLHPHGRVAATADAIVPVKFLAEDDFGLGEATLDVRQGGNAAWTAKLWPGAAPSAAPAAPAAARTGPQKRVHVYRAMDLRAFQGDAGVQVKSGDVLTLQVRAKDTGGLSADASEVAIEVLSPEEMAQRLTGEMSRLRDDLLQVRRAQRRTVGAIRELGQAAAAAPDAAALRRARDLQVDQGRAVNDVSRFTTGIERVLDAHVLDRLGAVPTVERLLPLYDEFLAKEPDDSGAVFPEALYARILEEKRANRLYDPEVVGILLDVMDLSERLRETEGPAAYDALERWAADGAHASTDLDVAAREAQQVLSTLDAIDERLQKFEDLAAIVQLARTIREAQDSLTKKAPAPEKK